MESFTSISYSDYFVAYLRFDFVAFLCDEKKSSFSSFKFIHVGSSPVEQRVLREFHRSRKIHQRILQFGQLKREEKKNDRSTEL